VGRWCLRAGCNLSVHPARHARGARVTSPAASMWWPTLVLCMGYPTLSAHASPHRSVQAVLVRRTNAGSLFSHFVKIYESEEDPF